MSDDIDSFRGRRVTTLRGGPAACGHCDGTGRIAQTVFRRVDRDGPPELLDRVARVIADHESYAPGRLAVSLSDYRLAERVLQVCGLDGDGST